MQWHEYAWKEDPELGQMRATGSDRTKMCVWYRSSDGRFDVVRGGGTSWTQAKCYHLIDAVSGDHLGVFRLQRDATAEAERLSTGG
ncbi:hypothetical protein GCM10011492_22930 [Flexivirga endophytica]|uniref:Uncharacterized protein n=1 Tax=Flexivirga endophytica TaxID=1849103 RepID=A0A916WSX7_9MICO|nr:hypothetical protein GCM10011492_22930 [Flexivirga endophytica]GHB52634.1 hypothetical protein GCM10008112_22200 [Flexivirga endophytica]